MKISLKQTIGSEKSVFFFVSISSQRLSLKTCLPMSSSQSLNLQKDKIIHPKDSSNLHLRESRKKTLQRISPFSHSHLKRRQFLFNLFWLNLTSHFFRASKGQKVYNRPCSWWEKRTSTNTGVIPTRSTPPTGPPKRLRTSWRSGWRSSVTRCPTSSSRSPWPRVSTSMRSRLRISTPSWKSFPKSTSAGSAWATFSW